MNAAEQVFVEQDIDFGGAYSKGLAELYGRSAFNFLRIFPVDFHSSCTNLQFTESKEVCLFLHNLTTTLCHLFSWSWYLLSNDITEENYPYV